MVPTLDLELHLIANLLVFCGFEPEHRVEPRWHSGAEQATRDDISEETQIVVCSQARRGIAIRQVRELRCW